MHMLPTIQPNGGVTARQPPPRTRSLPLARHCIRVGVVPDRPDQRDYGLPRDPVAGNVFFKEPLSSSHYLQLPTLAPSTGALLLLPQASPPNYISTVDTGPRSCLSVRTQPLTATGAPSQTSTIPYHTIPYHARAHAHSHIHTHTHTHTQ